VINEAKHEDPANPGTYIQDVEPTIWYRSYNATQTPKYRFETVNTASGYGTDVLATGKPVTGFIPPMQAFWVRTNIDGQKLIFNNTLRYHANPTIGETTITTTPLKTRTENSTNNQFLRLQVSNGTNIDQAIIYYNQNASDGFDIYDSQKRSEDNNSIPEIYTMVGTKQLVINGLNSVETANIVPLGFRTGTANTFSISATEIRGFESGTQIILKNNITGDQQLISEGISYTFDSPIVTNDSMFSLIIKAPGTVTDLTNTDKLHVLVYANANRQITVSGNEASSNISVYNTMGQKVYNTTATKSTMVIENSFAPGIYLSLIHISEPTRPY
jgi:hypothetical protein